MYRLIHNAEQWFYRKLISELSKILSCCIKQPLVLTYPLVNYTRDGPELIGLLVFTQKSNVKSQINFSKY